MTAATVAAVDSAVKEFDNEMTARTDTSAATDDGELKDAEMGKPVVDPITGVSVDVTLTDNSSETSDYIGTVAFESADGATQYGTGALFVDELNPGQTKTSDVVMLDNLPKNASEVVARLTDFDRMASF